MSNGEGRHREPEGASTQQQLPAEAKEDCGEAQVVWLSKNSGNRNEKATWEGAGRLHWRR
jgi:hypothetical protein